MLNRILYWFITLPVLGKTGCLTMIILVSACMLTSIASIPAGRARRAAEATQVAVNSTATSVSNATATTVAQQQARETEVAMAAEATQTSVAQTLHSTQEAIVASTARAQANAQATSGAIALAATSQANADATATVLAMPTPVPVAVEPVAYKELGRYEDAGRTWVNILIASDMSRETLIQLAQQLREQDVSSSFHLFDDESQVKQFVDAAVNYGNDAYPYPEKWATQHYIAMINEMTISRGQTQWQLIFQKEGDSVDIDVDKTDWGGKRKDGDVTEQEASGWKQQYLERAKGFACCVANAEIVDRQQMDVLVTLDGELASRPDQARQGLAAGLFTNFNSQLGECLRTVHFVDTKGNEFPTFYRNNTCS